jgi:hypothetical protein
LAPLAEGYQLSEVVRLRLNTMGLVQDLAINSSGWLNPDLTLDRFTFSLQSGLFSFSASGRVADGHLVCSVRSGNDRRTLRVPLKAVPYLPAAILEALGRAKAAPGERREFTIFDPATMAQGVVSVAEMGRETISLGRSKVDARKLQLTYRGVAQEAWLDDDGQVLMEKGLLGIRQVRVSRAEALSGTPQTGSSDLTRVAAVVPDRGLPDPVALSQLILQLEGVDLARYPLNDGRQSLEGRRLTVVREDLSDLPNQLAAERLPADVAAFLAPSAFVQSDHPRIRTLAAQLSDPNETPLVNVEHLVTWIQTHIEKRPVLSVPNALSTLQHRMGDCNEHAVLLAALARAAGYPAQVEAGLVYHEGRFYYHAWNRVYLGRWITVDALFGQIPADVSHIRFAHGSGPEQLDILPLLGNLRIRVIGMD